MKEMNKTAGHILEGVIEGLLMSVISGAKKKQPRIRPKSI